jgi:hypothetical protein
MHLPRHRLFFHLHRHLFNGIAQRCSRHLCLPLHHVVEDLRLVLFACLLEQPAVALLHHIVLVHEENVGDLKSLFQEEPLSGRQYQGHRRGAPKPPVFSAGPDFQVFDELGIHLHEGAQGVVAKRVALGPVVHVQIHPSLEYGKVLRLVLASQSVGPFEGDEGLFTKVGLQEIFAEREDLFFPDLPMI